MQRASGDPVRADRGGVGYLLNQAARGVRANLAAELRKHGLDDGDFIVLRNVVYAWERTGEGILATQMVESLNIPLPRVKAAADKLCRDGWLDLTDERGAVHLAPTQKATKAMPGFQDTARWTLEHSLNGFSRDEIAELSAYLERIVHNTKDAG